MGFLVRLLIAVLVWIVTVMIGYMVYNHEIDQNPGIVITSILLFLSLLSTLLCFIPNTVHRYLFGGQDRRWY